MTSGARASALDFVRTVHVGSGNRPKVEAVRSAIEAYVSGVRVEGMAVASGVAEQPVGLEEIAAGARNRAREAFARGRCDLAVGIEDGLAELPGLAEAALNIGVAVVTDGRREGVGLSSAFAYPPICREPALERREPIGDLFDALWCERRGEGAEAPSGRGIGNIGRLSLGVLTRTEYGRQAVLCALVPFLHPDLYPGERSGDGPPRTHASSAAPGDERTGEGA